MIRMRNAAVIALLAAAVGLIIGIWRPWPGAGGMDTTAVRQAEREILYWVAPMDANYRRDGPGKSPMGMDLVPVYAGETGGGDEVRISPTVVQNLGVRTAAAERGRLWRLIRAVGRVGIDEAKISHVHVRTDGWLEELAIDATGETVEPGGRIGRFYAPELVNAQKEFLQARSRGMAAITDAAREKLIALGMTEANIGELTRSGRALERIDVLAPSGGVVTELNVRRNMYVQPATVIASIADLSTVWVHADVYENQAAWIRIGQSAELRLDYRPGRVFEGRVELVEPVVDSASRTVRVRLRFPNDDGALMPNMYGSLRIFGGPKNDVLSIPLEALIRGAEVDRVVLALDVGRFTTQEVRAGMVSGGWVEILAGLEAGDRVVVSGQFLIDSEASMAGALRRLEAAEPAPGRAMLSGRVIRVKADGTATIAHDPVEALGWPAMTMDFEFADGYDGPEPTAGHAVHLVIEKQPDGRWPITTLHDQGPAGGDDP